MFKKVLCVASMLPVLLAQDAPETPTFLAADVHVTPPDSTASLAASLRDTQFESHGSTLLFIINRAYNLDSDHILGGPRRLDIDKYDIIAKVPPGTKIEAVPPMLKALLADRFHLVAKEETRPMISYALTPGRGKHKLKPAEGSEPRCNRSLVADNTQPMMHVACKANTSAMLADLIRSLSNGAIPAALADQTGLQGNWDFDLNVVPPGVAGSSIASLSSAVEDQLGLKVEQKRTDQPVLVIESINTVPTPNAPGVAEQMLPPAPFTIEVATIKPSAPENARNGIGLRPDPQGGMQLEARGTRLSNMIQQGWGLTPDRITGVPAGIDDQPFDIVAKLSGSAPLLLSAATLQPIFQSLLKERFSFVAHLENRPTDAYKLVATKPKMAKADPANRASCKREAAQAAITFTCRNITMGEFAERLQGYSAGSVRTPVVDATKLDGMYDFTLTFTPPAAAALAQPPSAAPVATVGAAPLPVAADPTNTVTFFEAISQLGLKLELEKRPMPVLVIEHLEKTPTEN